MQYAVILLKAALRKMQSSTTTESIFYFVETYERIITNAGSNMCKMKVKPSCYTAATQTVRTAVQAASPTLECYVLSNIQALILDLPIFIFNTSVLYR